MLYQNITAGSATQVYANTAKRVIVQVNAALTGTIKVSDEAAASPSGSPLVATITNPTVGTRYEYWGFQSGVGITPSTTCDITVSVDYSRLGNAT